MGVENIPAGLEKLLEIESPYPKKDVRFDQREYVFAIDALPDARIKEFPNVPLKYATTELKHEQKCRAAQDGNGKWVARCAMF